MNRKSLRNEYFAILNELNRPFSYAEFSYRDQLIEKAEELQKMIKEAGK